MTQTITQTEIGLQARIVQLEQELAECQREKELLRAGEARFRSYFELPLAGRAISSPTKGWLQVNATLCEMLGYTQDELKQMTWAQLTHPDDLAADVGQFNRVMAGEIDEYSIEKRFVRKDGQIVQTDLAVHGVRQDNGTVDYFVALLQDITERKRAEEKLRESEVQYRTLFEKANEGILYLSLDFKIIAVNESFARMHGYTIVEMQKMRLPDLDTPATTRQVPERATQLMARGNLQFEVEHYHKDGHVFPLEVSASLVTVGNEPFILAFHRDITERKQMKDALRAKTAELDRYFTHSLDLMCIADSAGYFRRLNPQWEKTLGYALAELEGKHLMDFVHPADRAATLATIEQLTAQRSVLNFENRYQCKDGSYRWIEWRSLPIGDLIYATARDITERKQAEETVRENEQFYRTILETAMDGFWMMDVPTGKILQVNQAYCQMSGYAHEELMGMTVFQLEVIEDAERVQAHVQRVMTQGSDRFESTHRRKDGSAFQVEISVTYLPHAGGRTVAFLRDITERKRAEELLYQSEDKYRRLIENSPDIVYIFSDRRGGVYYSPRVEQVLGYPAEHLYANPLLWNQSIHPDDLGAIALALERSAHGEPFDVNYRLRDARGEWRWLHDRSIDRRTENGETIIEGLASDITEQKRVLDELVQAKETAEANEQLKSDLLNKLNQAQQIAQIGSWDWNLASNTVWWSDETYHIFGVTPQDYTPGYASNNQFVHPADLPHFEKAVQQALETRQSVNTDLRIVTLAGILKHCNLQGQVINDTADRPDRFVGTLMDITHRKQAEQALGESEARFRQLFNSTPDAIYVHDQAGQIMDVNQVSCQSTGYTRDELLQMSVADIEVGLQSADLIPLWERIRAGQNATVEGMHRRRGGVTYPAEIHIAPFVSGDQFLFLAAARDMTERKQRERELEAVAQISTALRTATSRAAMLPVIAQQVFQLVHAANVALVFFDAAIQEYVIEHAQGVWENGIGQHVPKDKIVDYVFTEGKSYVTNDLPNDPNFHHRDLAGGLSAMVEIPLTTHQTIIGFMGVASYLPFSDQDVRVLEAIANIAANAIQRSTLHEQAEQSTVELKQAYDTTLEGWVHALELRDQETEGHTRRAVDMTVDLARAMGIGEADLEQVRRGALLHDIGKMGIPDSVLLKPGTLNEREWEIMRRHPEYAYQFLEPIDYLRPAIDIPYCHHEKWDGTGYPRGLKGEAIPLAARIFAIVDVWDALRSDRPYRKAWSPEKALEYIQEQTGSHFDPRVVETFLKLMATMPSGSLSNSSHPG